METSTLPSKASANQQFAYERVFDILPNYVAKHNNPDALVSKINGEWHKYSGEDFIQQANQLSIGLLKLGIQKNDKIALISPNRHEWKFVDL